MRNSKGIKIVGGIVVPDKKAKMIIPPDGALEFTMGKECIEIPVITSKRALHNER